MRILIVILAVAVLLLYLKWILLIVLYPMQALAAIYRNHPSAHTKILAAPNAVFEKTIGGGGALYHLPSLYIAVHAAAQMAIQRTGRTHREGRGYAL